MFYIFPLLMFQLCELVYKLVYKTANNLHNFPQIIERTLKSGCLGLIPLKYHWKPGSGGSCLLLEHSGGRAGRQKNPISINQKKKKATIGYLCMLGDRLDNLNDGNFLNFFFFLISSYLLKNFLVCGQSYLTLHLGLPGAVWLPQIQSIG